MATEKVRKYSLIVLTSPTTHYHTHWKMLEAPEIRIALCYGHTAVVPTSLIPRPSLSVCFRGAIYVCMSQYSLKYTEICTI